MTNQSTPIIKQFVALVALDNINSSMEFVEQLADDIVNDLDLTLVKKVSHQFTPTGITLAYLLSQSHLVIHTWPESGTVHIDLVMCADRSEKEFANTVKVALNEYEVSSIEIKTVNFDNI